MPKYQRVSLTVEAQRVTTANLNDLAEWCLGWVAGISLPLEDQEVRVNTNHGEASAQVGDWIIKNELGEFYPCDDKTFSLNYREIV